MRRISVVSAVLAVICLPLTSAAQDAQDILETARKKQLERWEGVDAYVVDQTVMGYSTSTWYMRAEVEQDDGSTEVVFLPVGQGQAQQNACGFGRMTPEALEAYAAGATMTGDAVASGVEDGLEEAGLPRGMLAATGDDPWNTMNPRVMMGGSSEFLRAAAEAQREQASYDPSKDAQDRLDHLAAFMENARLVGRETIDGRSAFHIRAEDIGEVQKIEDDQEYRMDTISMYIDAKDYVPLKMRIEGTMIEGKESRPMIIENMQSDYRAVPDSKMYESYRQVMKMSGMMSAEQEAQLKEATAQMAEMEEQLASMPPDQRQMVERMMGPQLERFRQMAAGGGFQNEVIVKSIRVNPATPDESGQACGPDAG